MSGGSYDYLCYKDIDNIDERTLKDMASDLKRNGYGDIAVVLYTFRETLIKTRCELNTQWGKLQGITKAWEWYQSNDTGKEDFDKAAKEYTEKAK